MDWERYRERCDAGDVLSRWMLEQTRELLERMDRPVLAERLARLARATPIDKPTDHRGGPETDFFQVDLTVTEAGEILDAVTRAAEHDERTSGTRGRGLGGFREAWGEYLDWQTGRHPRSPRRAR